LLRAINKGLDSITQAVSELQGGLEANTITCSATVAVASHWLKPLTDEFSLQSPNTRFVILASDEDDTLRNFEEVDVAIICGNERCEAGEEIHFLFPEVVKPVCSPSYFEEFGPFDSLEAVAAAHLLHLHQKHWNSAAIGWQPITWDHWFTAQGFRDIPHHSRLTSNNYTMLMDAAIEGDGITLGWQHIVQRSLIANRLQIAHHSSLKLERGNYLKLNAGSRETPIVKEFVKFVLAGLKDWKGW
jgi:DNA-binding transcriptional LysR family regulator